MLSVQGNPTDRRGIVLTQAIETLREVESGVFVPNACLKPRGEATESDPRGPSVDRII